MMNKQPDAFARLTNALKVLPNVGPKSAQRMAHHLLQHKRKEAQELVDALQHALKQVSHCAQCNTFCEGELCSICSDSTRDARRLMVVHMPADVSNMETANCHDGLYFVLMGQINPAQGMDISAIALDKLVGRLQQSEVEEIIIATNHTAEGDATAYVLAELFKTLPYRVSRLAKGIPLGGELEYVDAGTLAQAVYERRLLKEHEQTE
ncbi:recombination mediator RecR [Neisseria animalis]|uniref:Recombination protein RecR n=1 Tax=Neisseria animalis TaxID=492 RepID=A0A5P3MUZ1_NEIAN|nr:recombination mediator RecR [Neisseria animalis]QEY24895.1 recombination protein RecR [Neisseria animalis]ROW32529.1 recombination protein RecR [Neisseria animalis]